MKVNEVLEPDEFQKQAFSGSRKAEIDYITRIGIQLRFRMERINTALRNKSITDKEAKMRVTEKAALEKKYQEIVQKIRELTITGHSFCFTGFRDESMERTIEKLGGRCVSGVSGKTDFVVAEDPTEHSGKLAKAREFGTRVLSRQQMIHILRGDLPTK